MELTAFQHFKNQKCNINFTYIVKMNILYKLTDCMIIICLSNTSLKKKLVISTNNI